MNIRQLETGTIGAKNSVFVAFYTPAHFHYQSNEDCRAWGEETWYSKIALLGLVMRWDGSFGFVGGKVDEGETLTQGVIREVMEEVGTQIKEEQLTLLCSHEMKDGDFHQHTHLYLCKVTPCDIYAIQKGSTKSLHGAVEASGFNVVHMVNGAYENLRKLPWAGTAKEELELLLRSDVIDKPSVIFPEY